MPEATETAEDPDTAAGKPPQATGGRRLAADRFEVSALPSPPGVSRQPPAMCVFRDQIYLGTADHIVRSRADDPEWETVFQSRMRALTDRTAALAESLGLVKDGPAAAAMRLELCDSRSLGPFAVYKGRSDAEPCLYCVKQSIWGAEIMRSANGRQFREVGAPGLGDRRRAALSDLVEINGHLVTAEGPLMPLERNKGQLDPDRPVKLFASDDPGAGHWHEAAPDGLGSGVTGGVSAVAYAHDHVYVAVQNETHGFELWRSQADGSLPWTWKKVFDRGGQRFTLAPMVTATATFRGDLFLANGVSDVGFGKNRAGPGAAELLRVSRDGQWEVVMGQPRFSPDGLKVPWSGMGAGFGDGYNSLIFGLAEHQGVLYAGTRNCEAEYQLRRAEAGNATEITGGGALWASTDGEVWDQVFAHGNGNPSAIGIGPLCSTPDGLCAAVQLNSQVLAASLGEDGSGLEAFGLEVWVGR